MTRDAYEKIVAYLHACLCDSVHDEEHVWRVLSRALTIAETEPGVDWDVLVGACLLHDIGRKEQYDDPQKDHALVGGAKAEAFLRAQGFDPAYAAQVRACIETHRFRQNRPPQSLEAKILFDADKLDAAGAMGIARTLMYHGRQGWPLYVTDGQGGFDLSAESFLREYDYKLKNLYGHFYTRTGAALAAEAQAAAQAFYRALTDEIQNARLDANAVARFLSGGKETDL